MSTLSAAERRRVCGKTGVATSPNYRLPHVRKISPKLDVSASHDGEQYYASVVVEGIKTH